MNVGSPDLPPVQGCPILVLDEWPSMNTWSLSCPESFLHIQGCGVRWADWGNMVETELGVSGRFSPLKTLFVASFSRHLKNMSYFQTYCEKN